MVHKKVWYHCGVVSMLDHLNIAGWSIFSIQPHFIGFIVVNVRKSDCRVHSKEWNCRVGGSPTCFAEIAAGWSELFSDIAAGWSKKLNGIALTKMEQKSCRRHNIWCHKDTVWFKINNWGWNMNLASLIRTYTILSWMGTMFLDKKKLDFIESNCWITVYSIQHR